jgi:hypothetical protein
LKKTAGKGIIAFCKEALGFEPTDYQAKFLSSSPSIPVGNATPNLTIGTRASTEWNLGDDKASRRGLTSGQEGVAI